MLKRYFNNRSGFAKNIIALVSATAVAQGLNFAFNILLTRLYSPTDFGVLSVFMALVSFVAVISTGKYDVALVAAPERDEAKGLASLGMYITLAVAVLAMIAIWVIYIVPLNFYADNPVHRWFYFIPVSIILLSVFQVLWMWNVREKRFKQISFIRPLEAFINNGLCIFLKAYKELGLIVGSIGGQLVSASVITIISFKKDGAGVFIQPFNKLSQLAKKYQEFPRINILQGFVETLQMGVVVLVASQYFPSSEIGFYALCMRVLLAPARLIALPLAHVFFSEASEQYRQGQSIYGLVKRVTYQTGMWLIAMPVVLSIAGPFIFKLVFGPEWEQAGTYAAILSPWIFFDMIRAPIVQVASIVGKQRKILFITLASIILLLLSLIFGILDGLKFKTVLVLVSATQTIMCIYLIGTIFKMAETARLAESK